MNFSINCFLLEIASSRTAIVAVARLMELAGSAPDERARQRRDTGSGPYNHRYRNVHRENRGTTDATTAFAQVSFD